MRAQTRFNQLELRQGVYVFIRTPVAYESVQDIVDEAAFWRVRFPTSLRPRGVMLRDLRKVRGTNDPKIDKARNENNGTFFRGWGHITALMATEVGALHARRAFEAMGVQSIGCFTDEAKAMADAVAHLPGG